MVMQAVEKLDLNSIDKLYINGIGRNPRIGLEAKRLLYKLIEGEVGQRDPVDSVLEENLTYNGLRLLYTRYLLRDPDSLRVIETPGMMVRRVAESA
jgi:ribonucleotide reductase alpha subunit